MRHWHHVRIQMMHDPKRASEHDHNNDEGENQGRQRPATFRLGTHMEKEDHVNHDLNNGQPDDQDGRNRRRKGLGHDQREWDRCQ